MGLYKFYYIYIYICCYLFKQEHDVSAAAAAAKVAETVETAETAEEEEDEEQAGAGASQMEADEVARMYKSFVGED